MAKLLISWLNMIKRYEVFYRDYRANRNHLGGVIHICQKIGET